MSAAASILVDMGRRGGGVTRHGDRWRARLYVGDETISCGIHDSEALARAAIAGAQEELGEVELPGTTTLGRWGQRWLDERELSGDVRGWRQEQSAWKTHVSGARIAELPLKAITRPMVARWIAGIAKRRSPQTAKHALRLVRGALQAAADAGECDANVAADVKVPRKVADDASEAWTWLELDEIAQLLSAGYVPQPCRDLWAVAIYTGLRKGELAGLRWSDVHLGTRPHLTVLRSYDRTTKSGKGREVPLLPPALAALERIRSRTPGIGEALVWPGPGGRVWTGRNWEPGGWRRHALGHGRPDSGGVLDEERHVRFHDLRHTCASHLVQGSWLAQPMDLYRVKAWLGHSSISVTQRYAHLCPGGILDLAATWTDTNRHSDTDGKP